MFCYSYTVTVNVLYCFQENLVIAIIQMLVNVYGVIYHAAECDLHYHWGNNAIAIHTCLNFNQQTVLVQIGSR